MAEPTKDELKLIERFRENIRDLNLNNEQEEDMFLLSWIRARENDLIKAEDMLRKSLIWRKKEDIANIFDWHAPPSYASRYKSNKLSGVDNEGRSVFNLPLGTWDIRKAVEAGEREIYIRYVDQLLDKFMKIVRQSTNENGRRHTQFVIIIDMAGFTIRQLTSSSTVSTLLETFRRFEANYPETLKTVFIINTSRIFPLAYSFVKPLLSARTRSKIQIFNSNMSKWKPVLLECIPEKSLPSDYCQDSTAEVLHGGDGVLIAAIVEAGAKLNLDFNVLKANALLSWEFETLNFDIGFAVFHESSEVFSYSRWNSHLKKVEGAVVCQNPGRYTLSFDNTYSRIRPKSLRYSVSIVNED